MSRDDCLAELLEQWEEASAGGLAPTPEEICRGCPEILPDFRQLLARWGHLMPF